MSTRVGDDTINNFFGFNPPQNTGWWSDISPQTPAVLDVEFQGENSKESDVNDNDYGAIKMRLLESMTACQDRRTAGADLYAENLRYSYLIGKDRVSFAESTAQRLINESGSGRARQLA